MSETPRRPVVCHLSTGHRPDDMRIAHKECATLAVAGYDVRLVIPTDNAPDLGLGFRIVPVRKPATRRQRLLHSRRRVLRAALAQHADVYHFHDVDLLPVALALKARGKCVVYDAHENFPAQIRRMASIARPLRLPASLAVATLEKLVVACVDAIVAATPAIGRRFPSGKTWVVQNFPIEQELAPVVGGTPFDERPRRAIYVGGMSVARGAREMIAAMAAPAVHDSDLVLCAQFSPPVLREDLVGKPGWGRIRETGWVDRPRLAQEMGQARVGLVLFHAQPNHVEAQPNKLFEYMAAGLPVVASDFPLWREIVDGVGCGRLVDPRDPQAIAQAVGWLLDHPKEAEAMGQRGREAVQRQYTWATEGAKLRSLYESLVGAGSGALG